MNLSLITETTYSAQSLNDKEAYLQKASCYKQRKRQNEKEVIK